MTNYKNLLPLDSTLEHWYDICLEEIKPSYYHDFESVHGGHHVTRVLGLALSIVHAMKSEGIVNLTDDDIAIISLSATYHDVGRTHDWIDDEHGIESFKKITKQGILERFLAQHYPTFNNDSDNLKILKFVIENHCLGDYRAFNNLVEYNISNIERAKLLYSVVTDADSLDRVRLGDLDMRFIRNDVSKSFEDLAHDQFDIAPY